MKELKKSLDLAVLEKHSGYLTGLGLTLWYTGFGLEKYSDYLTGLGLILYVGVDLEKYSDYLSGLGLILLYTGLGLIN